MKKEDFERLKKLCQENDFELLNVDHEDNEKYYVIAKKKDIWEGVEFAECVKSSVTRFTEGKIYKVNPKGNGVDLCDFLIDNDYYPNGFVGSNREYFKPSTEAAYIEQLKKEAHERFGEIKEGDLFDRSALLDFKDTKSIGDCYGFEGFRYYKENDGLDFNGTCIYQQGKWAERVKERVEVSFSGCHHEDYKSHLAFQSEFFVYNNRGFDPKTASIFLASQLEDYLNK